MSEEKVEYSIPPTGGSALAESTPPPHEHIYVYALNQNHTLIRGCMRCGETHVTLAAGPDPNALVWHRIHDPGEP